jgi:predicted nucleotidyltransferase
MRRLNGENRIEELRQIAGLLKSEILLNRGICGIVFAGGLTRGFADKYSDVDIIVLLSARNERLRKKIQKIGSNAKARFGVDVDLEVHFFEDFENWKWSETTKWDFSHSQVVFDPDKRVQTLFNKKLRVSKQFWLKRIVICAEHLKWYCCPPKGEVGTIAEAWIDRGDMVSAHFCLDYALGLMIRILYALNREFLPSPKWKIFYSYNLKWLPSSYNELIVEALIVRNLSKHDLDRRLEAIRGLWSDVLFKIGRETGLTLELISSQYVKHVLGQS